MWILLWKLNSSDRIRKSTDRFSANAFLILRRERRRWNPASTTHFVKLNNKTDNLGFYYLGFTSTSVQQQQQQRSLFPKNFGVGPWIFNRLVRIRHMYSFLSFYSTKFEVGSVTCIIIIIIILMSLYYIWKENLSYNWVRKCK